MTEPRVGSRRRWALVPLLGAAALVAATLGVLTEVARADPAVVLLGANAPVPGLIVRFGIARDFSAGQVGGVAMSTDGR